MEKFPLGLYIVTHVLENRYISSYGKHFSEEESKKRLRLDGKIKEFVSIEAYTFSRKLIKI